MDSWLPYNIKATTVHKIRGGPGPKQIFCPLTSIAPLAHWGEPFHCPRQGVSYRTWGSGLPPKKKMREVEGRGSQGVKRKSEGQARGKSTAAGSSKRHFRLGGICGRPHYERMQVMQRNLTTASVNYNSKYTCTVMVMPLWCLIYTDTYIYMYMHAFSNTPLLDIDLIRLYSPFYCYMCM